MKLLVLILCLIAQLCLSIAHDAHFLSDAYIKKINNQQDLWQAISAAQAFTDRYCIKTRGRHQMRLSTANVMTCCKICGLGCIAGFEELAWKYFYTHGLPSGGDWNSTEGCQPYVIKSPCRHFDAPGPYEKCDRNSDTPTCQLKCTNSLYNKSIDKDYRFATQEYMLPNKEKIIMKEIMTHGPVTASFVVMSDFVSYKSGVYEPTEDAKSLEGHAIKLIGWGVEKKVPYWLVMNSWNEYWGDHGLVKMKRGSPKINLEDQIFAAEANTKKTVAESLEEDEEEYLYAK